MYCIYHSRDLGGWMSAAIVKKWHDEHADDTVSREDLIMIGWDYGNPLPLIEPGPKVIMVDISFPKLNMCDINKKNQFIWIDHHISAIKSIDSADILIFGLRDTKYAACELTWKYFFPDETMPEVVRLLGRYDCFGHKGTSEEQKVLEFQYGARANMFDVDTCYNVLKNWTLQLEYSIHVAGYEIYNYLWYNDNGKVDCSVICKEFGGGGHAGLPVLFPMI